MWPLVWSDRCMPAIQKFNTKTCSDVGKYLIATEKSHTNLRLCVLSFSTSLAFVPDEKCDSNLAVQQAGVTVAMGTSMARAAMCDSLLRDGIRCARMHYEKCWMHTAVCLPSGHTYIGRLHCSYHMSSTGDSCYLQQCAWYAIGKGI
jgi:hypothetical protein